MNRLLRPPAAPASGSRAGLRADLVAAGIAVALVVVAAAVGGLLYVTGHPVRVSTPPLFAKWLPHLGPGTPAALAVAVLVVWRGPAVAAALPWRRLLAGSYLAGTAWIVALALVDGPRRGMADRLTTPPEYLSDVDKVTSVGALLSHFTDGIVHGWTTHVAGHPPGAFLVFVLLDRAGLGGGGWAAALCVAVGALVAVAVPVTVRAVAGEAAARAAVPFVVLFPGAVWMGVSADGLFAGVTATGIALLAAGGRGRALGGGLLLGLGLFLSYGLVLLAPIALVAALCTNGGLRRLRWAALGVAAVVAAFTAAGFHWWDGYQQVRIRYYDGIASHRAYAYWVWANLAALALCAGPAAAPMLRRARRFPLVAAAALAILAADLSGLSKAETERIWLPFAVWISAAAGLLPPETRRGWLAAQAVTALLVNHLLLTDW